MAQDDDNPLKRWSRRKREAARGPEPEPEGRDEPAGAPESDSEDDPDLIAALPDIDSLTLRSDFTVFLRSGVPAALRNRALARLWRMDPVFANLDGLVEYGEDYRAQMMATAGQKIASLYRAGRGMISPQEALAELERLAKQAGPNSAAAAEKVEAGSADGPAADAAAGNPTVSAPAAAEPPAALPVSSGRAPCGTDQVIAGIVDNSRREDPVAVPATKASATTRSGRSDTAPKASRGKAASRRWGRHS